VTTPPGPLGAENDLVLELLASTADAGDFTVAVTLWTSAGIVSGDLVGAPAWIRALRQEVRSSGDPQAAVFAADLDGVERHLVTDAAAAQLSREPLHHLHLLDAKTLMATGEVFPHRLWRCRFADVTGWTLGKL
jgi:hypothetical protein